MCRVEKRHKSVVFMHATKGCNFIYANIIVLIMVVMACGVRISFKKTTFLSMYLEGLRRWATRPTNKHVQCLVLVFEFVLELAVENLDLQPREILNSRVYRIYTRRQAS